ncbi:MAG: hypothetical protein HY371_03080 [Devosia nanyangense]|nr:hypothetical protein [Devosia nanyangense]
MKKIALFLFLAATALVSPALAFKEIEVQKRYCAGLQINQHLSDGSEVDCVKGDLAIEVDFTDHWAQAIGQSLHYARLTQTRPSIILVCNDTVSTATCERHLTRMIDTLNYWRIGMLVWFCNSRFDRSLDDCEFTDLYETSSGEVSQ